jgi:hypothetical protein
LWYFLKKGGDLRVLRILMLIAKDEFPDFFWLSKNGG